MIARMMRKMHVPAYAPVEVGVHPLEKSGVEWSVVKTMDMEDMEDMDMPVDDELDDDVVIECMSWFMLSLSC